MNGGPKTGSSAVHVAAKHGDTSGDGTYSAFDAVLAARVAAFKDTGLAAYPMVDPVVVADVSGNGDIKRQWWLQVFLAMEAQLDQVTTLLKHNECNLPREWPV